MALAWPRAAEPLLPWAGFLLVHGLLVSVLAGFAAFLVALYLSGLRDPRLAFVSAAFSFASFMAVAHTLAFPAAWWPLVPPWIQPFHAPWIFSFWHGGFALILCVGAVLLPRVPSNVSHRAANRTAWLSLLLPPLFGALLIGLTPETPLVAQSREGFRIAWQGLSREALVVIHLLTLAAFVVRARPLSPLKVWLGTSVLLSFFAVALVLHAGERFTIGWYTAAGMRIAVALVFLAALLWEFHVMFRRVDQANANLHDLATQDALTRLPNRRAYDERIEADLARARRDGSPLALLVVDIDFFKSYNDSFGHAAGDRCIRRVADVLRASARRPGDLVARYGGEEFVVLLPDTPIEGAMRLGEEICARVRRKRIQAARSVHEGVVTVSVGVAATDAEAREDAHGLFEAADAALYAAKQAGRNRVVQGEL